MRWTTDEANAGVTWSGQDSNGKCWHEKPRKQTERRVQQRISHGSKSKKQTRRGSRPENKIKSEQLDLKCKDDP